ncbi:hypothetical protein GKZ90_0020845 [Flavobacterium sp. MC2016-06]|jgi:hypothetical protein|uniref:hypothetical protein n=1 Tax=Flavobacterium sp. MC2016-06 TaxID=2676308 RepID=UPI0012BA68A9|nr:hypothetical protein [Flavobacterium sp. MC2016-06]MBU3860784.1 hypothetical protein [Flavobacterium sp. MC2016-06]
MPNLNLNNKEFSVGIEIDETSNSFKSKKELAEHQTSKTEYTSLEDFCFDANKPLYGMTPEQYLEGAKFHNEWLAKLKNYESN